jgi:hypothetical protein
MQQCSNCKFEKSSTDFHRRRTVCKECVKLDRKEKERVYLEKANEITKDCTLCQQKLDGTKFRYDSNICFDCTKKKNNRVTNKPTADMPDKQCTKCTVVKKATEYRFRTNICIECEKQAMYEWRKKNPEKFKEHLQRYRSKPQYREKLNEYHRNKYNTDMIERISHLCRHRIRQLIRNKKDGIHHELLGCSYNRLIQWLEYNFDETMNWDNYGNIWHIDHIRPCASFDLTNEIEQRKCFHWTNMAPLSVSENISKGKKIIPEYINFYEKQVINYLIENPLEET